MSHWVESDDSTFPNHWEWYVDIVLLESEDRRDTEMYQDLWRRRTSRQEVNPRPRGRRDGDESNKMKVFLYKMIWRINYSGDRVPSAQHNFIAYAWLHLLPHHEQKIRGRGKNRTVAPFKRKDKIIQDWDGNVQPRDGLLWQSPNKYFPLKKKSLNKYRLSKFPCCLNKQNRN